MCYHWQGDDLVLELRVQPKASRDAFGEVLDGRLKVHITAPPVDGKANKHLIGFLAKSFKVAKSRVRLLKGESSRNKRLCIENPQRLPDPIKPADR